MNPLGSLLERGRRALRLSAPPWRLQCEEELSQGRFASRQSLWIVTSDRLLGYLGSLPDRMETEHLRGIERLSLRLCRCRRSGTLVEVRLLNRWRVLGLRDQRTLREARRCQRRWTLEPGLLCRPGAKGDLGALTLGAEATPAQGGYLRWRLWCEVEGFPSRFLPDARKGWPPRWLGSLYATYHRWTCAALLKGLAHDLMNAPLPGAPPGRR